MASASSRYDSRVAHERHATLEWPHTIPFPSSLLPFGPSPLHSRPFPLSSSPSLPHFRSFSRSTPGKSTKTVRKISHEKATTSIFFCLCVCVCVCSRACAWSLRSESLGALLAERESPSSWTTVTQGPQTAGPTQHGTARFPGSKGFSISKEGLRGPVGGPGPRAVGLGGRGRGAERDW